MKKLDKFRKLPAIIFSIGFVLIVIGVSYAFFTYSRTGLYTHEIEGGKMGVIYNETTGNNVTLENAFPLTDEEALTRGVEFEWTVTGFNESPKTIYYAIEMEYGNTIDSKTRFSDTDIKLSLYENNNLIFENEIYDNLNKQDIYYGSFPSGTSADTPTVNNYKIRLWINDNVMITDTTNTVDTTNKHVYSTAEFEKKYASFKINIRANLTNMRVGYLTYDANGGENAPDPTELTTNRVTTKRPTNSGKSFLGWATSKDATVPKYRPGSIYTGMAQTLYAVWSDTQNIMSSFPTTITNQKSNITKVYFVNDAQSKIDAKYDSASIKADLTYGNTGSVKGWLETDPDNSSMYVLYIGSDGITFLSTASYLFSSFENVTLIDFSNVDTSKTTNMFSMFQYCYKLKELDLSNFNTSQVINMTYMFSGCSSLTNIDVSSFDTSNVKYMVRLFSGCSKLSELDITNFNTSQVKDMSCMFYGCSTLNSVDVSNFDTSNVTNMDSMFHECVNLTTIDVSSFNTGKVTCMSSMFSMGFVGGSKLTKIITGAYFDTSNVTTMNSMFYKCSNLSELNIDLFRTYNVTDMGCMFYGCSSLTNTVFNFLKYSNDFSTSRVTNMNAMFRGCSTITYLDLKSFDVSNVTNMTLIFAYCSRLEYLNIKSFGLSSDNTVLTQHDSMFYGMKNSCRVLVKNTTAQDWVIKMAKLDAVTWTTSNVIVVA